MDPKLATLAACNDAANGSCALSIDEVRGEVVQIMSRSTLAKACL